MSMTEHAADRLLQIARARTAVMQEGRTLSAAQPGGWVDRPWLERSWRRCLEGGRLPGERIAFDQVPAQAMRRVHEANQQLLAAAQPVLGRLARAIASTRYFAILTDRAGVVIDAQGPIDRADRRAQLITRTGVDLSEPAVGTTAIGAALGELQPVWLHRGEHFFDDTGCYSCAGAPLFGPQGRCVGMLDLTGIDAVERPELKHLVAQAARSIENALTVAQPHRLLVRLNWPGRTLGGEDDGLVAIDPHGQVTGANQAARQMVPQLALPGAPVHCSDWIAQPWEPLFDLAAQATEQPPVELLLWSGLRLAARPERPGAAAPAPRTPLRDVEIALIRKAVADARGNVTRAAQALGISRATVYRKLAQR
jgi:sigma-54 dependent transcriptional regulator, acetoin dehydrogenase operon transcriptional activator AcoR